MVFIKILYQLTVYRLRLLNPRRIDPGPRLLSLYPFLSCFPSPIPRVCQFAHLMLSVLRQPLAAVVVAAEAAAEAACPILLHVITEQPDVCSVFGVWLVLLIKALKALRTRDVGRAPFNSCFVALFLSRIVSYCLILSRIVSSVRPCVRASRPSYGVRPVRIAIGCMAVWLYGCKALSLYIQIMTLDVVSVVS
jgi:hypothetical protein